jgi:KDO2-lipid IV(A) lauroyltransferase
MIQWIFNLTLRIIWFLTKNLMKFLPMKVNYHLAYLLSLIGYLLMRVRRTIVKEEVSRLYGSQLSEKDKARIVRRSFIIFFKRQVENLLFGDFTKKRLEQISCIVGLDHLNRALEKEKGVILLLVHFGSFLLPLPVLGLRGYKVNQVAGKPLLSGRAAIYRTIFMARKEESDKIPIKFIQTDQYIGPIFKALRKNEIVVIAFDGRTAKKCIPVRILNRVGQFSLGPFNLALKTGATILPTFVVRGVKDKHRIIFEPPLELEITDKLEEANQKNIEQFIRIFERYLLAYPCHFAMTLYVVRREVESGINPPLFID